MTISITLSTNQNFQGRSPSVDHHHTSQQQHQRSPGGSTRCCPISWDQRYYSLNCLIPFLGLGALNINPDQQSHLRFYRLHYRIENHHILSLYIFLDIVCLVSRALVCNVLHCGFDSCRPLPLLLVQWYWSRCLHRCSRSSRSRCCRCCLRGCCHRRPNRRFCCCRSRCHICCCLQRWLSEVLLWLLPSCLDDVYQASLEDWF